MYIKLLIILLSSLIASASYAQNDISFYEFNKSMGLSTDKVKCIFKDSKGFLWVGTTDGLNRFDGYSFITYKNIPGDTTTISSNNISAIEEDEEGNLWIATTMGINIYDWHTGDFSHLLHDESKINTLSHNRVSDILVDHNNTIWVATRMGLNKVVRNDGEIEFETYYPPRLNMLDTKEWSIGKLFEDSRSNLWLGTYGKGLCLFNKKDKKFRYFLPDDLTSSGNDDLISVIDIAEDFKGNIVVIFFNKGLYRFNNISGTFSRFPKYINQDENFINALSIETDRDDNYWIGTKENVYIVEPEEESVVYQRNTKGISKTKDQVNVLYKDKDGLIWIGYGSDGIELFDPTVDLFSKWHVSLASSTEYRDYITSIYQQDDMTFWLGTYGNGVIKIDPDGQILARYMLGGNEEDQTENIIYELVPDEKGHLWIASGSGISMIDLSSGNLSRNYIIKYDTNGEANYNDGVRQVMINDDNKLWCVPINSRPYIFDINTGKILDDPIFDIIKNAKISYVFQDAELDYWIGTNSGVYLYNQENMEVINYSVDLYNSNSLCNNEIKYIYQDSEGYIWIGTRSGISVLDKKTVTFTNFTIEKGFSGGDVNNIIEDCNGNIWIRSVDALYMYDKISELFREYNVQDGLSPKSFNIDKSLDGSILLTDQKGFYFFHPDSVNKNEQLPKVVFTRINAAGKLFKNGMYSLDKDKSLENDEIVLKNTQKFLILEFSTLNYSQPERINYSYFLEGYNNSWEYLGNSNELTLVNLRPGKYELKVRASYPNSVWSDNATALNIEILPPWWRTSWAKFVYVLIGILIALLYRSIIISKEKVKNKYVLERVNVQKKHEIDRLKLNFFINVSHEFRSPLTLILDPVKKLISIEKEESKAELLKVIYRNSRNLQRLVSQILDIRKFDLGKMKPEPRKGVLRDFFREIITSYKAIADINQKKFIVINSIDDSEYIFDQDKLEKISNNLLSNAFKYSPDNGEIKMELAIREGLPLINSNESNDNGRLVVDNTLELDHNFLSLSVSDNGAGIELNEICNIFDRFYKANNIDNLKVDHAGIGLALTKQLIEILNGRLYMQTVKDGGTKFHVLLPVAQYSSFDKSSISVETNDEISITGESISKDITEDTGTYDDTSTRPVFVCHDEAIDKNNVHSVLVVEDDHELRQYLYQLLFAQRYVVKKAENGLKAIEIVKNSQIDLVISDIRMPEMDGIKFCKTLKENSDTCHIPIILLTVKESAAIQQESFKSGADAFLGKPFDSEVLLVLVNNLIKNRKVLREKYNNSDILPIGTRLTKKDELFLEKAVQLVEDNISDSDLSVDFICSNLCISPAHLYRKLKKLSNQSITEFVRTIRLNKAAQILKCGKNIPVAELAYTVGFSDPNYFTRKFKEHFAVSPTKYNARYLTNY